MNISKITKYFCTIFIKNDKNKILIKFFMQKRRKIFLNFVGK